ncbi:MAG: phosphoribosylanthranilate isomerase, partial [Bacteroidota bacterium]
VDEDAHQIEDTARTYGLDYIQLHGNESPAQCKELQASGLQLIKVFSVANSFDFEVLKPYEEWVDFFLFDTKGKLPGGNGYTFDWEQMSNYPSEVPFFLSGGIGPEHRAVVKQLDLPKLYALDVNSKFEIRPGFKDVAKLKEFWLDQ